MGKCSTKVKTVSFDVTDEQVTKVVVTIDYWGDCPVPGLRGMYEKTFPARIPMVDLFTIEGGIKDYLLW